MTTTNDGGPAFPKPLDPYPNMQGAERGASGMSLRDYLAAHAPIAINDAVQIYGAYPNMNKNDERGAFMAVWSFLRYAYADAMLAQRSEDS